MFHVKHLLSKKLKKFNIKHGEDAEEKLSIYVGELLEWNTKINLISRRLTPEEVVEKLIIPSLMPLEMLKPEEKTMDFGAGAGIVGIPIMLTDERVNVDLLESKRKPVVFLRHISSLLSLSFRIINRYIESGDELPFFYGTVLLRGINPDSIPEGMGKRLIYYGDYRGDKYSRGRIIKKGEWTVSELFF